MSVESREFGATTEGPVTLFTLSAGDLVARIATLGATITELLAPDREGRAANVVLGGERLEHYRAGRFPAAAVIGRYANRIAGARFELDGREYRLASNNGRNHLHGGLRGFHRALWQAEPVAYREGASLRLTYLSPDGEEGYPGSLSVVVTYTLTATNEVRIEYRAITDRPTPLNLTSHAYFNLTGAGDVLAHELWIDAASYTPVDDELIPTGEIAPVQGTPLDFTRPAPIGARITELSPKPGGYDHNLVLRAGRGPETSCARLRDPASGRVLEVFTTEPGIQLYSGNHLGAVRSPDGGAFGRHAAVCLETQHFPDSVHWPAFPPVILRPGDEFVSRTAYRLGVDQSPSYFE